MASHTTVGSFVGALHQLPEKIERAQVKAVAGAALALKTSVLAQLTQASGGDLRLSRVGRNGAKVGVSYTVRPGKHPSAWVRATGPVSLIERGTKAHQIPRARRRGRGLLVINGQVVTGPIQHPGTQGKYPWRHGVDRARPVIRRILGRLNVWG